MNDNPKRVRVLRKANHKTDTALCAVQMNGAKSAKPVAFPAHGDIISRQIIVLSIVLSIVFIVQGIILKTLKHAVI